MQKHPRITYGCLLLLGLFSSSQSASAAGKNTAYQAALDSIAAQEMFQTVDDLAGPKFEGREAGSTGGHAAGDYLVEQFRKLPLKPAGERQRLLPAVWQQLPQYPRHPAGKRSSLEGPGDRCRRRITITWATAAPATTTRRGRSIPAPTTMPAAPRASSSWRALFPACRLLPGDRFCSCSLTARKRASWARSIGRPIRPCRLSRVKFMLNLDMIGALRADRVLVFGSPHGRRACGGWQA